MKLSAWVGNLRADAVLCDTGRTVFLALAIVEIVFVSAGQTASALLAPFTSHAVGFALAVLSFVRPIHDSSFEADKWHSAHATKQPQSRRHSARGTLAFPDAVGL